ncbi:MAG: hypothetical protein AAFN27_04580 [Pseudomonadota bacterium]
MRILKSTIRFLEKHKQAVWSLFIRYIFGNPWRSVCIMIFGAGVGLLSQNELLPFVLHNLANKTPLEEPEGQSAADYASFTGLALIAVSLVALFLLFRADQSSQVEKLKSEAATLAGSLNAIADAFDLPQEKSAGFQMVEVIRAIDKALDLQPKLPADIAGEVLFSKLVQNGPVSDGSQPLFDVTTENLRTIAACLKQFSEGSK